jgi:hypothetical protein
VTAPRRPRWSRRALLAALAAAAAAPVGCSRPDQPNRPNEMRMWTENFAIRVTADPTPPRALEPIRYTVVVRDKATNQPIRGGQGRIYATNEDRKTIANGLEEGTEPGVYRTNLLFVTAGPWAMALQFRRDSTQTLQTTPDWMQDIRLASEPGQ